MPRRESGLSVVGVQRLRPQRRERAAIEALELRRLLAAHIVGSSTSYATIQAAVNAATSGATLTVDAGTYPEEVTITKSLTIQGAKAGTDARTSGRLNDGGTGESILDGALSSGVRSAAFYINANDVTIDGFTVQGETDQTDPTSAGIVIAPNHHGTHVINSIVQNNVSGLFLANNSTTDAAVIQYDVFQHNNNDGDNGGRGIYTDQSIFGSILENVTIDSNTFISNYGGAGTTGLEAAVALEATVSGEQTNIHITNNTMTNNGKAVLAFDATNLTITGNTATGSQDQYSGTFRFEGNVQNVTVEYNNIDNNTGPAVAVDSKATSGTNSGFVVNDNNLYGNNAAYSIPISVVFEADDYSGTFDARNNWWGSATGPSGDGTGTGDAASAGMFQAGAGLGWKLLAGGSLLYSPWSTSIVLPPGVTPTAPNGVTATASGLAQVTLDWTDTSPSLESGFIIQSSTDGVNFNQVGTTGAGITRFVDTTAAAGMNYTYKVEATSSNGNSPFSATAIASTPAIGSTSTNLSSLNWVSATTGYGTIQKNLSVNGNTLSIDGVTYSSGIGTHAVSQIVYNLAGAYTNFMSDVGVDGEENGKGTGSVDFQVVGDGKTLFDSGVLSNPQAPTSLNVNVSGVQTLTIVATNGVPNSIDYDHSDWAGAQLIAPAPNGPPVAPSGLKVTAASTSQVNLSWTNSTSNATGFVIQRSTDGVNFRQIGTTTGSAATTYTDTVVLAGQTYIYRVAATSASNGTSPFSATVSATTTGTLQITTVLSSIMPTSATAGWGVVEDNLSVGGNPITLNGVVYPTGIGTHAVSNIVYNLGGAYTNFLSDLGVDAEEKGKGNSAIDFQVIGDGKTLFDSGVLTNSSATVSININVTGVKTLTLTATNGVSGSIDYDHADWAGAKLLSAANQPPAAPSNLVATPSSQTQVNLSWTNNAGNATGLLIERATGSSTNFVQIGTVALSGALNGAANATTYFDTTAMPGTPYTYEVVATNGTLNSSPSNAASATTLSASAVITNLSSLKWTSATVGWGTIQLNKSISGNTLSLRGNTYSTGIGAHAVSQIVYHLGANDTSFISDVGVDDEENGKGIGSVEFQVMGDGKVLFDSGVLTNNSPVVSLDVNVSGVQTLTLLATNGVAGSIDYDHADWAGARLVS